MIDAVAVADTNHLAFVVEPHTYYWLAVEGKDTAAAAAVDTQEHNSYECQMMEVPAMTEIQWLVMYMLNKSLTNDL